MNPIKLKQIYVEYLPQQANTSTWSPRSFSATSPDIIEYYKSILIDADEVLYITPVGRSDHDGSLITFKINGQQLQVANTVDEIYSILATEALERSIK